MIVITLAAFGAASATDRPGGEPASETSGEFREMSAVNARGDLMTLRALGYTDAQLRAIADHFARQPCQPALEARPLRPGGRAKAG
jgi:cytochrome c553